MDLASRPVDRRDLASGHGPVLAAPGGRLVDDGPDALAPDPFCTARMPANPDATLRALPAFPPGPPAGFGASGCPHGGGLGPAGDPGAIGRVGRHAFGTDRGPSVARVGAH